MSGTHGRRSPATNLGLLDATMIGIGAMIGAGIFVLTGLAAETAGAGAIVAFALNGGVTTFTALSYAELAAAIPKNGGGYAYVREAFSSPVAFVMGWTRWFTYMAAGALYALGFSSNFVELVHLYWPGLPSSEPWIVAYALFAVVSFVGLNAVSTEASGGAETLVTAVKIVILLVFVAFGIGAIDGANFVPLFPAEGGALTVLPAMGLTFIAFQGYDLIATVTEEVENPTTNIPRAILASVVVTVVVYLLVVGVAIGTLGPEAVGGRRRDRRRGGGDRLHARRGRVRRAARRGAHRVRRGVLDDQRAQRRRHRVEPRRVRDGPRAPTAGPPRADPPPGSGRRGSPSPPARW